jgi:hypothetical protein
MAEGVLAPPQAETVKHIRSVVGLYRADLRDLAGKGELSVCPRLALSDEGCRRKAADRGRWRDQPGDVVACSFVRLTETG